jgi:hypothetical protein
LSVVCIIVPEKVAVVPYRGTLEETTLAVAGKVVSLNESLAVAMVMLNKSSLSLPVITGSVMPAVRRRQRIAAKRLIISAGADDLLLDFQ